MARRAAPYRIRSRDGFAHFYATIRGERFRESLGVPYPERPSRSETRAAEEAAAKRFAELVDGRTLQAHDRILTSATLEELYAMWLDAIETPNNKASIQTKTIYGRHFSAWASKEGEIGDARTPLERIVDDAGPADYALARLSQVQRETVRKELVDLFAFFKWAKLRKHLASIPPRPELSLAEPGVRSGPQRESPVHIEPEEARAIIAALPEWSVGRRRKDGERAGQYRVRAVFEIAWETALRPSTIARLRVPANYSRGSTTLRILAEDDKVRYKREVTLTQRARDILDRIAPERGSIFGTHDYRDYIKAAALKVLPAEKAADFARYDLRHGRAIHMLSVSGDLPGVSYLLGHKQMTTTNKYLKAQKGHADRVIDALDGTEESENSDTIPSREEPEPSPDSDSPSCFSDSSESGRVDSNHRPLDPQGSETSVSSGKDGPGGSSRNVKKRGESALSGKIPSRIRHATQAKAALIIEGAIWDAFDRFSFDAESDGGLR